MNINDIITIKHHSDGYQVWLFDEQTAFVPVGHRFEKIINDWVNQGNTIEPEVTPDERKVQLKQYINQTRTKHEQGTFIWNNWRFDCDLISVARITGAMTYINSGGTFGGSPQFAWTDADNVDRPMTDIDILNMYEALVVHTETCHIVSRELKDGVDAGSITTESQIDNAGWTNN